MVSRLRRLSLCFALNIKDSDKGHEPQTTNLYQEHTDQLTPNIVGRSNRLGKRPVTQTMDTVVKEMVKIGGLGATCLDKWQTQKKRAYKITQAKLKKIRRAGDKRPKVSLIFSQMI